MKDNELTDEYLAYASSLRHERGYGMPSNVLSDRINSLSPWGIFRTIFRISATTLGGGAVMIGVIKQEMLRQGLISDEKLTDMITLSLSSPGPMANSMSFQVGWELAGAAGAAAAVIGMALPPFITILVLASWLLTHMGMGHTSAFFGGAAAGLVILMGSIVFDILKKSVARSKINWFVCVGLSAAMIAGLPPIHALFGGTVLSLVLHEWDRRRAQK